MSPVVVAIDAGTTGIRSVAIDAVGTIVGWSYRELTQHFPRPGWVEHDPAEILTGVHQTLRELESLLAAKGSTVAAIGITNQRETVVAWDRGTGSPLHQAIVWQDRRTATRCDELAAEGHLAFVRAKTGLVLDPYFSGSKMEWLLRHGEGVVDAPDLALGTVDDWVLWNLTGVHATDPSNASRTMLYDIGTRQWSGELCELFGVPMRSLGDVVPSSGRMGIVNDGPFAGTAVSGMLGDQQAALLGQACTQPGMAKCTYGTGSFLLMNVGPSCPPPVDGLLSTVAWDLGTHGFAYALEGAIFVTGAAIQWLRDGLGIIESAADIGPLASSVVSTDGVVVVPAFTGLGSPWWDPYARGAVLGITRGTRRAHLARAVVESIAFQVRDVADRMVDVSATPLAELRADGGACVMDLLLELQADQLGVVVRRPIVTETTALGAAYAAGLAEDVWGAPADLVSAWHEDAMFAPAADRLEATKAFETWHRALERSRGWAAG